jgi:hypothetical protein
MTECAECGAAFTRYKSNHNFCCAAHANRYRQRAFHARRKELLTVTDGLLDSHSGEVARLDEENERLMAEVARLERENVKLQEQVEAQARMLRRATGFKL